LVPESEWRVALRRDQPSSVAVDLPPRTGKNPGVVRYTFLTAVEELDSLL
jgi:hypothetical protein